MKRGKSKSKKRARAAALRSPGTFSEELKRAGINTRILAGKLARLVTETGNSGTATQAMLRAVQECLRYVQPAGRGGREDEFGESGVMLIHEVARPDRSEVEEGEDEEDESEEDEGLVIH